MIPMHMITLGAEGILAHRFGDPEVATGQTRRFALEDAAAVLGAVLGSREALAERLYRALEREWECHAARDRLGRPVRCGVHGGVWCADEDRCEAGWIIAATCAELIFAPEVAS